MTYAQVQDGDEDIAGTDYVKFDAFFLRDLDGDGYAESVRGSCRKIEQNDTLYMELNVLTNGELRDGIITIEGKNVTLRTAIPKDNEIKENAIGSNIKEIKFNTLKNGTQKLLTGVISASIGDNINDYSKINSVTLKGTHVADDGTETIIEKKVEFNTDWHGTVKADIPSIIAGYRNLSQEQNLEDAINEEENTFTVEGKIGIQEINNQLILKKAHIEVQIPELNEYAPQKVEIVGDNETYTYNEETRTLIVDKEAEINENGDVIKRIYTGTYAGNRYNQLNLKITYPLEAYKVSDGNIVELKIPVKGYYEGFNNMEEEFTNPYKSNDASSTIILTVSDPRGTVARFEVAVGKYLSSPRGRYIVSKEKPLKVYNEVSEPQLDDTYIVRWRGITGSDGKSTGMTMKEDPEEISDKFIKTDSSTINIEDIVSNVGIYFSNPEKLLGTDGWINVYDNETNELLETFTKDNWSKYNESNPYKYEKPINHIRVETSETNVDADIYVYNVKRLNDEEITSRYTKEEFSNLQYIRSTLIGYLGQVSINTAVHSAEYEVPYTTQGITINKNILSTQETEKNMTITIKADALENLNQTKWVNGAFIVKMPENVIYTEINNVSIDNPSVKIISYEQFEKDEVTYLKINTENSNPEAFNITINCEVTPNPQIITRTEYFELYAYNENAVEYWNKTADVLDINDNLNTSEMIGKSSTSISLVSPDSLLTSQMITNYDDNESVTIAPRIAEIEKDKRTVDFNVVITNNYSNTISEVKILGKIPFEGNKYVINKSELGSVFSTEMTTEGITIPRELQNKAITYYSEKSDVTNDLSDNNNAWTTTPKDFSKVKSYLIDLGEYTLARGEKHTFTYTVNVPEGLKYNQVSYGHHAVYFSLDTESGKYKTQTEPNKVGIMIAKKYDLEITKYQKDKDNLVSGATYSIAEENSEESKTRVTNENGKLVLEKLYIDRTYIIKEIKTPNNYELNSEEIKFKATEENGEIKVTVISGTIKKAEAVQAQEEQGYKIEIDVEDEIRARLKIVKTEKGIETNAISAVKFKLTGKNFETGRILTTNINGEAILQGISIGEEYTLEEVTAKGYYLLESPIKFIVTNSNGIYTINLTGGEVKNSEITEENGIPIANFKIENEKIPTYNLQINKVIKGETTPLQGARFRLFKESEKINDYITDENGIITINNLYQYEETKGINQTYTLKELSAPEGYSVIKDITFKVSKNAEGLLVIDIEEGKIKEQKVGENNTVIITIEDSKSFKLVKTDGETGEVLPNTKFAIYNVDNGTQEIARDSKNNILGTKEIINGKEYYTLITNEKGEIEADLKEGLYKAIEVKASHNKYDITNNTYYFGIGVSREGKEEMLPQWSTAFGGSSDDEIKTVANTIDGGWIAGGYFNGTIQIGEMEYVSKGNKDGIIIKYNSIGEVEWVNTLGGNNNDGIQSVTVTMDGGWIAGGYFSETIQVGEQTYTSKGGTDGILIKYSSTGEIEWSNSFGESRNDEITSVDEGLNGKIIVGGKFQKELKEGAYTYIRTHGIVMKYSSAGKIEWTTTFEEYSSQINTVASTIDGGWVVGGCFYDTIHVGEKEYTSNGNDDGILIKYSNIGEIEWSYTYGGNSNDEITTISATSDGGWIAGGYFSGTIQIGEQTYTSKRSADGILIKYSNTGEIEWLDTLGGGGSDDKITSVVLTEDGGYIVGGYFCSAAQTGDKTYIMSSRGHFDGIIIKYNTTGEVDWLTTFGESGKAYTNSITEISDGEIIVGGCFDNTVKIRDKTYVSNGGKDGIIIKYNKNEMSNSRVIFAESIGGNSEEYITAIAATADGGYIAGGYFNGTIEIGDKTYTCTPGDSSYDYDSIIIKYNKNNEVEWSSTYGGSGDDRITSVAAIKDGGYIVGGCFDGTIEIGDKTYIPKGYDDALLIKYNAIGEIEWSYTFGGIYSEQINSVVATDDGGYVVVGGFTGTIQLEDNIHISKGSSDGILIKYNKDNEVEKTITFGGYSFDEITSVATTTDGGYIVGGSIRRQVQIGDKIHDRGEYDDGIVIKYDSDGNALWSYSYGNKGDGEQVTAVAETTDGGYIVAGSFYEIQLGDKKYVSYESWMSDNILIKYSKDGEVEWSTSINGNNYQGRGSKSIIPTDDGGFVIEIYSCGTSQIGDYRLIGASSSEGILLKFNNNNNIEWKRELGAGSRIESVDKMADGGFILGGCFENNIELDGKTLINKGESDGMILKVADYAGIPETEVLPVENVRKEFKITTEVKDENGIKGGTISGENDLVYEIVKYGDNSKENNRIVMTPDENYEIAEITINDENWKFTAEPDGTYTMPIFENMTEDKHIVVSYILKDNKITINKIDRETHEPISGVKFKLDEFEERSTPENAIGTLTDNSDIFVSVVPKGEITGIVGNLIENSNTFIECEIKDEIDGILGELTDSGTSGYYFIKNEDGTYVPANSNKYDTTNNKNNTTANSYIQIDLTGKTGKYAVKVNAYVSSESGYDFGYATITEDTAVPVYSNNMGRFMYISGDLTTPTDYTSMILEGGKTYYLHLGYRKDGSGNSGEDQVVINSIKLYEAEEIIKKYNFMEENEKYKSTNQGKDNTTANSYIPIDLTDKTGKYIVEVNAEISSEEDYDYGYVTITENTTAPGIGDYEGQFIYISGIIEAKNYTTVLEGGQEYYLHLGYYKDSIGNSGEDQFIINSIKTYEAEEKSDTYNFIEEDGKYKSTNQGKDNTTANSYIPIDLTEYTGAYDLIVNAEISSEEYSDYGYATITEDTAAPGIYDDREQFIYISGTLEAEDYTTVLDGGKKYYLHLGYYKDESEYDGKDIFTVNNIKIEPNGDHLYHTEVTTNGIGQAITKIPFGKYTLTEVSGPDKYQQLEEPVIIEFKSDSSAIIENGNKVNITVNDEGEFIVENNPKSRVIVHHYLKDRNGENTTIQIAEDEIIYGDYDKLYTTVPHLDLDKYELEKDENGKYIMPENATGIFREENEDVIYYYQEKQYPVIVHHYVTGTMIPVLLADGTIAKDEKILGYEGDIYITNIKENLAHGYEFDFAEGVLEGTHTDGTIEVTYYYKATTDIEIVKKWDHTNNKYEIPESVTVELMADGEVIQEITLTRENKVIIEGELKNQETWKYTVTGLPKYDDSDKHEIVYTIREK